MGETWKGSKWMHMFFQMNSNERAPCPDRLKARMEIFCNWGPSKKKYSFRIWGAFSLKMTWKENMKWQGNGKTRKPLKKHKLTWGKELQEKERQRQSAKNTAQKLEDFIYYALTTTNRILKEKDSNEVVEQWCSILTCNNKHNLDANTILQSILTRHGKDMKEVTTKQKLSPKGWKALVVTTSPLRITLLGSYRRTPLPGQFFGLQLATPLPNWEWDWRTWKEAMKRPEKTWRMDRLAKELKEKEGQRQQAKRLTPQSSKISCAVLPLDYYRSLFGGKWITRSDRAVILYIDV